MSPDPATGARGGRLRGIGFRGWVAVACGLHLAAGALLFEPTLFPGGDNAGYMILAEALRSGAGYVDLHLPDAPVHTKYPPAYPTLLAVLGWMGGLQLFKLSSLALTTGAVAFAAGLGRRWGDTPMIGVLAGLLFALNPVLLDYSHYVLSEALFVFLVLLSLWAAARSDRDRRGSRWFGLAVAAAAAAFLTRTAGLPLLAALVALPALRKQRRRAASAAAAAVLVAGGWALFQRLGAPDQAGYLQQLLMVDPYDPAAGTVGPAGLVRRTAENFWRYVVDVLPGSLTGDGAAPGPLRGVVGILVAGLAVCGWTRRCVGEIRAGELFVFLYLGTVAAWPSVWTDRRFLLPVLPLIVIYGLIGVSTLAGALGSGGSGNREAGSAALAGRLQTLVVAGVAALLAAGELRAVGAKVPDRLRCLRAYRAGDPCVAPRQASFYAAARWASGKTPPDAVFINRKPRIFYWISRRRGTVYPYSSEPEVVMAGIDEAGADYVVIDRISGTTARYLVPAVEAHRSRFRVVYREGSPPTWILRYRLPAGTALGRPGPGPAGPAGRGDG